MSRFEIIQDQDAIPVINQAIRSLQKTKQTIQRHQVNGQNRIKALDSNNHEVKLNFRRVLTAITGETDRIRCSIRNRPEPSPPDSGPDSEKLQQAPIRPKPQRLRARLYHWDFGLSGGDQIKSINLNHITMYKPPFKTYEELKAEKKNLLDKIINGSHLDAIAMGGYQKALAEKEEEINAHPDHPQNSGKREEVVSEQ